MVIEIGGDGQGATVVMAEVVGHESKREALGTEQGGLG